MLSQYDLDTAHSVYAAVYGDKAMRNFAVTIKFNDLQKTVTVPAESILAAMNEVYVNRVRVVNATKEEDLGDNLSRYAVQVNVCDELASVGITGHNPYEVIHAVSGSMLEILSCVELPEQVAPTDGLAASG